MNAERLHIIARTLKDELAERETVSSLASLVTALQRIVQQNTANTQQNLVDARDSFYQAVTDTPSDSFTPAWRQILIEIGGNDLFGRNLKERVQQILADNQMTPGVAQEQLDEIHDRLESFSGALNQLIAAFDHFNIGAEELPPGEAEIALLIPRDAVDNRLGDFTEELEDIKFILNTFSELATGHKDDLRIRTLSSSGLMLFLAANPKFAALVAKVIDFIVGQYKKILEIKKLQKEIDRLDLPEEISQKTKDHANTLMEAEIDKFTVKIVNEYKGKDGARHNELRNAVTISLNKIANKVDRGFNFEVRIENQIEEADGELKKAVQTIKSAATNMQYMKLEGPPILELPEKIKTEHVQVKVADNKEKKRKGKKARTVKALTDGPTTAPSTDGNS
jgi:hypothetical protein